VAEEGGAGGREVGRISIRVVPNLDRFRSELQSRLDEIEKDVKCKVRIDPDMDGFRERVDAASRDLKDAKVKVKTEFDRKGDLIHDLDAAIDEAKGHAKLDVTPKIQQSTFQKALRDVKTQAKLANVKLDVDFRDVEAERRLESLISRLKAIAALQRINLRVGTNRPLGQSRTGRFFGSARGAIETGAQGIAQGAGAALEGLGHAFSLLKDQTVLIAVAIVSLLAPALALFSQAIVGLPALLAGIALPLGVFALGIGGIKKALDDSGILTDTKGKGGKDKQGLGTVIKNLQQQVSDVFEQGFTPIFRQMADVIPQLTRGLPFVAQGIVSLARSMTNAVVTPQFISNFDRFTNSVGTMLTRLGPGLGSFTTAMSNLITNVGDHLPGLGNVMSGWADRFSSWVTKISKPKENWFGQDIPNSSTLDSAVTNLKPILNSIVNFVGQLTDAGLKLAANPQMADNIKKVVDGITNMITNLLPQLNSVFDKIALIMGKIDPAGSKPKDPALPSAKGNEQFANTPKGNAPADRKDNPQGDQSPFVPKTGFGLIEKWLQDTFTRPHTDHPVIVEGNVGAQQQPQQVQSPKVDMGGIAQSIQGGAGAIAAAANAAFKALSDAATVAVSQAVQAVQQLPGAIAKALSGVYQAALAAGQSIGTGMAAGIAASAPSAIAAATALAQGVAAATSHALEHHSPSKVFQRIGESTGQGFEIGMNDSFQSVLDSAKNLSQQVSDAMKNGTQGIGPQFGKDIQKQLSALDLERQQLRVQYDATTDKGQRKQLEAQMKQLGAAGDQLRLQKDQLGYSDKYGDGVGKADDKMQKQLGGSLNKMVDIGKNFAMSNVNQFESDIGISGQGAIPTLANMGLDWGTQMLSGLVTNAFGGGHQGKTEIHVNSVDEALEAKRTTDNRRALTHNAGR
jgi:hypothetical protein